MRISSPEASHRHQLQYLFLYAGLCHLVFLHICVCKFLAGLRRTSVGSFLTCFHPSLLQRGTLLFVTRRDRNCPSLSPSLSLVTFSVWLFVPEVPRLPAGNCICIMDKGGRPRGKTPATMNRDREVDEKANPNKGKRGRKARTARGSISSQGTRVPRYPGERIRLCRRRPCRQLMCVCVRVCVHVRQNCVT